MTSRRVPGRVGGVAARFLRVIVCIAVSFALPAVARAHDMSRSLSNLDIRGRQVRALLTIDTTAWPGVDANVDGAVSIEELDEAVERVSDDVTRHFTVRSAGAAVRPTVERYEPFEGHLVRMELLYLFEQEVTSVQITSTLHQITQPDHRHLTSVTMGGTVHEAILDAASPDVEFATDSTSPLDTVRDFVRLGVEHIFSGYDHLAFLIGLLVATTSMGSLVKMITSFTVAHSITLALATFDVVVLPGRLTESLIALSIGYVAVENLLGTRAIARHHVTFLFGLVHGFGFSRLLRDMQLPRENLMLSLFSFNAGVEVGQIVFICLAFPLIAWAASSPRYRVRPAVSLGVACLAVYWFVQRAFLS